MASIKEEEVKLIGNLPSMASRKVEIALQLKGIKYEFLEEHDLKHNKSPELLKYNPVHKKVPVLIHSGRPIAESLVILEYIDETWTQEPALLPSDPYERASARFWSKFIDDKCYPAVRKYLTLGSETEVESARAEAQEGLQFLENELKGKKYFGGETIGMVDVVAVGVAFWQQTLEEIMQMEPANSCQDFPLLCAWADELLGCSVISDNLPSKDKFSSLIQSRLQFAAAASAASK
ncbi:putative glutathione S-transferase [Drosera capensis]